MSRDFKSCDLYFECCLVSSIRIDHLILFKTHLVLIQVKHVLFENSRRQNIFKIMTTRLILKIIIFKIPFNPTINNYSYHHPNFDPGYTALFKADATYTNVLGRRDPRTKTEWFRAERFGPGLRTKSRTKPDRQKIEISDRTGPGPAKNEHSDKTRPVSRKI